MRVQQGVPPAQVHHGTGGHRSRGGGVARPDSRPIGPGAPAGTAVRRATPTATGAPAQPLPASVARSYGSVPSGVRARIFGMRGVAVAGPAH